MAHFLTKLSDYCFYPLMYQMRGVTGYIFNAFFTNFILGDIANIYLSLSLFTYFV